jgi:hypothetical protein
MSKKRKVVVTTAHRGVFFGVLVEENGTVAVLEECRNCLYWSSSEKGFLGLAANGPSASCRVGPAAVRTKLHDVTSVTDCTSEAVEKWEAGPWST